YELTQEAISGATTIGLLVAARCGNGYGGGSAAAKKEIPVPVARQRVYRRSGTGNGCGGRTIIAGPKALPGSVEAGQDAIGAPGSGAIVGTIIAPKLVSAVGGVVAVGGQRYFVGSGYIKKIFFRV